MTTRKQIQTNRRTFRYGRCLGRQCTTALQLLRHGQLIEKTKSPQSDGHESEK